jgi:hypothetical protein
MLISFGIKQVELSKAFVYLTNIPKGVVESTNLSNIIPAPVLKIVFTSICSSGLGINPNSPVLVSLLHKIFIGPQFA